MSGGIRVTVVASPSVSLEVGEDCFLLRVRGKELRFPPAWGRKFALWVQEGRSHNVVCNADPDRYNLLGVTKERSDYVFTFLEAGRPAAVLLTADEVASLLPALGGGA